ncbi:amidohydrolase family protein [Streptomyces sp. 8L]|uniref:amidohydrolase family protein n=1 Tax=Streptomyces sp. 8L TaxID=2877242 RepID=UPI001CD6BF1B|nr:amidohydrolase family protein [Streptomyces sp. 8L]MCA1218655.1 amidohydrolase [Streptomyces sp. 8L]
MTTGPEQLIDVHAHFVTESYIEAARAAGVVRPDGMGGYPAWSAQDHLRLMDEGGIRTSVLSISSPGTHFGDDRAARELSREVNEFGARLRHRHPGRFGHFASLPLPDVSGSLTELAYAFDELGSDGVTVETNAHGAYLGDGQFDPVWAELDRRGAPVFVHPTSPPNWEAVSPDRPRPMMEFIFDSARAAGDLLLNGVLTRYPRIQWVFTHGGGALPLLADRIALFQAFFQGAEESGPSVQDQLRGLWFDMAGTPFPNQVPALVKAFGDQRLVYGSDYCWTPAAGAAAQIASVDAAAQPEGDTWRALTTRNALRLLPSLEG